MAAKILVAAVDVQDDRLEVFVDAFGRGLESWGIKHHVIMSDPSEDTTWELLDKELDKLYLHEDGSKKKISLTFIDTGGHHTKRVYDYVKTREVRQIYGTKGSNMQK